MSKGNLRRHVSVRRTAQMLFNEWPHSRVPWSSNPNPKRSGRRWNGSDTTLCECRNLLANPSMAMTIFDSHQRWENPGRGIQLFGSGQRTGGSQADHAESVYGTRFPAFARWMKGTTPTERRQAALLRSYALFRFLPSRVKILDEADFGGAVFIIASVRRNPNRDGPFRIERVWEATERLVASRGDGLR